MIYPEVLTNVVDSFKKIPGVGEKSAERYAFSLSELSDEDIDIFVTSVKEMKQKLRRCSICGHITDHDECSICTDKTRNNNLICVVEDYKSVFMFEKSGSFKGKYHVLNGLISPIDGKNPEDLNIGSLVNDRINKDLKEIIIALSPSINGDITSLYIQKILEKKNVKVSRLSYGIPMGGDIEYLDPIMISKAWDDRKVISNN